MPTLHRRPICKDDICLLQRGPQSDHTNEVLAIHLGNDSRGRGLTFATPKVILMFISGRWCPAATDLRECLSSTAVRAH